jgi:hypothetical protein
LSHPAHLAQPWPTIKRRKKGKKASSFLHVLLPLVFLAPGERKTKGESFLRREGKEGGSRGSSAAKAMDASGVNPRLLALIEVTTIYRP